MATLSDEVSNLHSFVQRGASGDSRDPAACAPKGPVQTRAGADQHLRNPAPLARLGLVQSNTGGPVATLRPRAAEAA